MATKKFAPTYAVQGDYGINAYSAEAAVLKEQFLKDAAAMARAVGKSLEAHGFETKRVSKNRAGIAVSGEVWGEYQKGDIHLLVEYGASSMRGGFFPVRECDGLIVMAQVRSERNQIISQNIWTEPTQNSYHIAEALAFEFQRWERGANR